MTTRPGAVRDAADPTKVEFVLTQLEVGMDNPPIGLFGYAFDRELIGPAVHEFPVPLNVQVLEVSMRLVIVSLR